MKNSIYRIFLGFFLIFAVQMSHAAGNRLFHITRSLNRNIVCYDLRLSGNAINQKEPIHVYWENHENAPGATTELTFVQRKMAFGYSVKSVSATEATVVLTAYNKRTIKVCKHDGKWVAIVKINGKDCVLTEIYAKAKNAVTVEYIELRGKALADGTVQKETIKP